ncbi:hypothetical protein ACF08N_09005 [Streptomyces sp. NPDC015127]|uniref:hypothetical protein n=1 Tax=Streptomyces sp. NPDC015127 TaxID=3364939 RepID=UPI0037016B58
MRTRMRRGAAAVLTASALCLTAVACGSEDDKKPSSSAEKDGAKDAASEKPAEDEKASTEPLTAAQMKAATLELGDLPSGWTVNKVPAGDDPAPKADKPECQPIADIFGDEIKGATKGGDVDFLQKSEKTELSQHVFTFPGTGAADYVKAIDTALATCTTVPFDMAGTKVPVKIARVDAPKAGEASHAFTMTMEFAAGIEVKANMLIAHQGTGATRVAYKNDGGAEAQKNFADLVTRVGDKLVKGATS